MDKEVEGKRIQNWHRRLPENGLKKRYLRNLHGETAQENWESFLPSRDEYWDPYGDGYYDDDEDYDYKESYWLFDLDRKIRTLVSNECLTPIFGVPQFSSAHAAANESSQASLEQRLFDHLQIIKHLPDNINSQLELLGTTRKDMQEVFAVRPLCRNAQYQQVSLCLIAATFQKFLLRSPGVFQSQQVDVSALLHHLLVKDEERSIPFMRVFDDFTWTGLKWFLWAIILGSQGSLQRAGKLFGWRIPTKYQYYLESIDPTAELPIQPQNIEDIEYREFLTAKEVAMYAEVLRLGGNTLDFCRLRNTQAFMIDPTELVDESYLRFWSEAVQWLAFHRNSLNEEECTLVLEWALHEHTEMERDARANLKFSWKGRTSASALRNARQFRETFYRRSSGYYTSWKSNNLSWETTFEDEQWQFVELSNGAALFLEGRTLRHCVGGYAGQCAAGQTAIVSLRRDGRPRITIEVNLNTRKVRQARGHCNRPANEEESTIIRHWVSSWVNLL